MARGLAQQMELRGMVIHDGGMQARRHPACWAETARAEEA